MSALILYTSDDGQTRLHRQLSDSVVKESLTVQSEGASSEAPDQLLQPRPDSGLRLPRALAAWRAVSPVGQYTSG